MAIISPFGFLKHCDNERTEGSNKRILKLNLGYGNLERLLDDAAAQVQTPNDKISVRLKTNPYMFNFDHALMGVRSVIQDARKFKI